MREPGGCGLFGQTPRFRCPVVLKQSNCSAEKIRQNRGRVHIDRPPMLRQCDRLAVKWVCPLGAAVSPSQAQSPHHHHVYRYGHDEKVTRTQTEECVRQADTRSPNVQNVNESEMHTERQTGDNLTRSQIVRSTVRKSRTERREPEKQTCESHGQAMSLTDARIHTCRLRESHAKIQSETIKQGDKNSQTE